MTEQAKCMWGKLDLHIEKSQSGVEKVLIFTVTSSNQSGHVMVSPGPNTAC